MIKEKSVLAIVFASGESKALVRREMRLLAEKPLLAWSIESARSSRFIDRLIVSTADVEVAELARCLHIDVPFRSTLSECSWSACALEAIAHLAQFDFLVMLDAKAPLRLPIDIDGALEVCARYGGAPVITVSETRFRPSALVTLDSSRRMQRYPADYANSAEAIDFAPEEHARLYCINGSIAAASRTYLVENRSFLTADTHAYILPPERSLTIESKTDLAFAQGLLDRVGMSGVWQLPNITKAPETVPDLSVRERALPD